MRLVDCYVFPRKVFLQKTALFGCYVTATLKISELRESQRSEGVTMAPSPLWTEPAGIRGEHQGNGKCVWAEKMERTSEGGGN